MIVRLFYSVALLVITSASFCQGLMVAAQDAERINIENETRVDTAHDLPDSEDHGEWIRGTSSSSTDMIRPDELLNANTTIRDPETDTRIDSQYNRKLPLSLAGTTPRNRNVNRARPHARQYNVRAHQTNPRNANRRNGATARHNTNGGQKEGNRKRNPQPKNEKQGKGNPRPNNGNGGYNNNGGSNQNKDANAHYHHVHGNHQMLYPYDHPYPYDNHDNEGPIVIILPADPEYGATDVPSLMPSLSNAPSLSDAPSISKIPSLMPSTSYAPSLTNYPSSKPFVIV